MTWQQWILIATFVFSGLYPVALIDKPRRRLRAEAVALGVAVNALFVWMVATL